MKKLSYLLAAALLCVTPLAFAIDDISLIVECDKSSSGEGDSKCDSYIFKTNPALFEAKNLAFNRDKVNNEYDIMSRIIPLPGSKGIKPGESCGSIMTGNEKITCPMEEGIPYSNEYDVYMIVNFKLGSQTCRCFSYKLPHTVSK